MLNEPMLEIFAVVEQGEALDETSEIQLMESFREAVIEAGALLSQAMEGYETALSVAPLDLRSDLVALRDSTVAFWPILVDAAETTGTIVELNAALERGMPDSKIHEVAIAGRAAGLRLDQFTVPQCGFKMSNP